jgi:large subunit ribosomal protein L18
MDKNKWKKNKWLVRKKRVRVKIRGTADRPRLSVYRSLKHIYVQAIDDIVGATIASCSTLDKEFREKISGGTKKEKAYEVGKLIAQRLLAKGIEKVVFDRSGYKYHGRLKALAEGARENGLKF